MELFSYQPEILSSINFISSFWIGNIPATVYAAGFFLVLFFLLRLTVRRLSLPTAIIMAALIAWSPVGARFAYNVFRDFRESRFLLGRPVAERIIWRYCAIDKTQDVKGLLCGVYPFIEGLKQRLPEHSVIMVVDSELKPYVAYYLYPHYRLTEDSAAAEYVVVYAPKHAFAYQDGLLLQRGLEKPLGHFRMVSAFSPDQIIFQRTEN